MAETGADEKQLSLDEKKQYIEQILSSYNLEAKISGSSDENLSQEPPRKKEPLISYTTFAGIATGIFLTAMGYGIRKGVKNSGGWSKVKNSDVKLATKALLTATGIIGIFGIGTIFAIREGLNIRSLDDFSEKMKSMKSISTDQHKQ